MKNFKRLIGKKIQARRVEMGFSSQHELASELGVDQSRVSIWEGGKYLPEEKHQKQLMAILKVDESFFDIDPSTENSRADLISSIVSALPSMNENELRLIATGIKTAPSQSPARKLAK